MCMEAICSLLLTVCVCIYTFITLGPVYEQSAIKYYFMICGRCSFKEIFVSEFVAISWVV